MLSYLLLAYLIGSLPIAYLLTRWFSGRDIRQIGSRNAGTTNVVRNAGWLPGVITLLGDMAKGYLAALVGGLASLPVVGYITPAFAIVGHNWPVWLRFRGGGGLATFVGACMAFSGLPLALAGILVWGLLYLLCRSHDLSAIIACVLMPFLLLLARQSLDTVLFTASSSLVVLVRRLQSIHEHALAARNRSHGLKTS